MHPAHISPNTIQGSLRDASLQRLLDSCHKSLVTGRIDIDAGDCEGWIELRAGAVDSASSGDLSGTPAVDRLRLLEDGDYEISQRLPDLAGDLGSAASFRGELKDLTLVSLMRYCEDNALTCGIVIVHEFDRGEIDYRGGEIVRVSFNGAEDEDRIVDMVRLKDARFLVTAPPLDVHIDGWPVVRGDPTAPFRIEHLASRPPVRNRSSATPPPIPPRLQTVPPGLLFYALDDNDDAIPGGEIADVPADREDTARIGLIATRQPDRKRRPRRTGMRRWMASALGRAGRHLGSWAERLTPPVARGYDEDVLQPRTGWLRRLFGGRSGG
jgi:hypothetical protein